jgi:hypothetical protein
VCTRAGRPISDAAEVRAKAQGPWGIRDREGPQDRPGVGLSGAHQNPREKCALVEGDLAFRMFDAALAGLGAVRQMAGGS